MPEAGITHRLAEFSLGSAALPDPVMAQARRAFLNYLACAFAGVDEQACMLALAQADEFSGPRRCTVVGRALRLDAPHAALVNCMQSSIQTFDDTHLPSVIHPTGPVAAALMALIEHRELAVDGTQFLDALARGIEVSCRIASALTAPGSGLHLGHFTTCITGGIGAASACGRLLQLDLRQQCLAIGIAATQAGGLRVSHGTMTGGLAPALSARAGLASALLAQAGFDGSASAIEGVNGILPVLAPGARADVAVSGLGSRFEMAELAYKPYPCGIVIHPSIDACLDIAADARGEGVESVSLRVHPLALQLTGQRHPHNAMSCNISLYHWVAAALLRGRAGLGEATQPAVDDGAIASLRGRIEASADESLRRDEAIAQVRFASGRAATVHVEHARGSRERPMSDDDLAAKFMALAAPHLGEGAASRLLGGCAALPAMPPHLLTSLFASCAAPQAAISTLSASR